MSTPVAERPQIHQIRLPLSWSFDHTLVYLIDSDPLTLIDVGVRSEESRAALEAALEELGHGVTDIERVVLTHGHRDHFGLVQSLRSAGAEIECLVHAADAAMVEDYTSVVRRRAVETMALYREYGVPEAILDAMQAARLVELVAEEAEGEATVVDRVLHDADLVEWKDFSLRVHHSPGHTPGHVVLADEETAVLFTGDQVMAQAIPHAENFYLDGMPDPADALHRRPRFRGLVELRKSLRRLRGGPSKTLLPAYGGVVRRADRTIRDTLLYYDVRLQRIDRGFRGLAAMGQDVTGYEIWKALFPPDEPLAEMRSQLLLVIGALDCLEEDGHLVTDRRPDGILTHHHR